MLSYLVATTIAATSLAAAQPAQWEADYGTALAATRKSDRPLLVVLDAPQDEKTRIDAKLLDPKGAYAEQLGAYELCRVDAASDYGKRVVKAFGATTTPQVTIIDKRGAVVLFKHRGQMTAEAWKNMLTKHSSGERQTRVAQTSYYRGGSTVEPPSYSTSVSSPSYCPSCQRRGY